MKWDNCKIIKFSNFKLILYAELCFKMEMILTAGAKVEHLSQSA
jgi:hypothetical protein